MTANNISFIRDQPIQSKLSILNKDVININSFPTHYQKNSLTDLPHKKVEQSSLFGNLKMGPQTPKPSHMCTLRQVNHNVKLQNINDSRGSKLSPFRPIENISSFVVSKACMPLLQENSGQEKIMKSNESNHILQPSHNLSKKYSQSLLCTQNECSHLTHTNVRKRRDECDKSLSTLPQKKLKTSGRWTRDEHNKFLRGLKIHGREWKKVSEMISTRSSAQIRSHAQKFFSKLAKEGGNVDNLECSVSATSLTPEFVRDNPLKGNYSSSFPNSSCSGSSDYLSSFCLQKIELIISNPSGVEAEVTQTLEKLHARHKQLQRQLAAKEQHDHSAMQVQRDKRQLSTKRICGKGKVEPMMGPATAALNRQLLEAASQNKICKNRGEDVIFSARSYPSISPPSLIPLTPLETTSQNKEETHTANLIRRCSDDDIKSSSVSSLSSSSLIASCSEHRNRQFGAKELIALQVLGGGLPSFINPKR